MILTAGSGRGWACTFQRAADSTSALPSMVRLCSTRLPIRMDVRSRDSRSTVACSLAEEIDTLAALASSDVLRVRSTSASSRRARVIPIRSLSDLLAAGRS